MMSQRFIEIIVGFFVLLAAVALLVLALKVSGISNIKSSRSYEVTAQFDNIGSLTVGAPISIAGVKIGEVKNIALDSKTFRATVTLGLYVQDNNLPLDSTANIYTQGLLGAQYISITPGFSNENLKQGSVIQTTHSAMILENLIGQFLYQTKNKS